MFGKPVISAECDLDGCQAPSLRTQLQAARERIEVLEKAMEKCRRWSTVHVVANMEAIHAEATAALSTSAPDTK